MWGRGAEPSIALLALLTGYEIYSGLYSVIHVEDIYIYIYMYIYMCIYICVYIYMYKDTLLTNQCTWNGIGIYGSIGTGNLWICWICIPSI